MIRHTGAFAALLLTTAAWGGPTDFTQAQWARVSEGDGIEIYNWKVPGVETPAYQARTEIDLPIARAIAVISDTSRRNEWAPQVKEARVLKRVSKTRWTEYWYLKTPPMVDDRDLIIEINVAFDAKEKKLVVTYHSVEDADVPQSGAVRAHALGGSYILWPSADGKKTHFIYNGHIDLGGSIPRIFAGAFEQDYPRDTLKALRKQGLKSDIVDNAKAPLLFEGKKTIDELL